MNRPGSESPSGALPFGLAGLDRDLREIAIEERCSFGPELRAKLEEEYRQLRSCGHPRLLWRISGRWLATAAAILMVAGTLAVPPARASWVRLFRPPPPEPAEPAVPAGLGDAGPEPPEPQVVPGFADLESAEVPETFAIPSLPTPPEPSDVRRPPVSVPPTFPALRDRDKARRIVGDEYPDSLQRQGIGGTARVLLWVGPDGSADHAGVVGSSGVPELDTAALRATRSFWFQPATQGGRAVGTWVEFSIRFLPAANAQPHPEYQAFRILLSN